MAFEIEIKAHVDKDDVDRVKKAILELEGAKYLGSTSKFDIYWSKTEDGNPIFRTRQEITSDGANILVTAKPYKEKTIGGLENNREYEFSIPISQWDDVLTFCSEAVKLQICRIKFKKGFGYHVDMDGFSVHVELLDVKYLGWFIEMEICPKSLDGFDEEGAEAALRKILNLVGISKTAIEPLGYNKMLKKDGHDRG